MEIKIKKVGKNLNVFFGEDVVTLQSPSKELVEEIKVNLEKYSKLKSKTTGTAIKLAEKLKTLATPVTTAKAEEKEAKKVKIKAEKKVIEKEVGKKSKAKATSEEPKTTQQLIAELSAKDSLSKDEVDQLQKLIDQYKEEKAKQEPAKQGNYGRREY